MLAPGALHAKVCDLFAPFGSITIARAFAVDRAGARRMLFGRTGGSKDREETMAIVGIDAVIYGVDSLEKGRRFFEDWGLARARSGKGTVVMEAQDGAQVILKPRDAKDLPKAIERGNTVREVVWGVGS